MLPRQQIKPAPPDQITEKPSGDGADDPPAGEAATEADGETNGGPDGDADAETAEKVADKSTASALKGAKRWRKKEKARAISSEAITRSPSAAKAKTAAATATPELGGQPTVWQQIHWIMLAFVPSSPTRCSGRSFLRVCDVICGMAARIRTTAPIPAQGSVPSATAKPPPGAA